MVVAVGFIFIIIAVGAELVFDNLMRGDERVHEAR